VASTYICQALPRGSLATAASASDNVKDVSIGGGVSGPHRWTVYPVGDRKANQFVVADANRRGARRGPVNVQQHLRAVDKGLTKHRVHIYFTFISHI
jgi:hypothetical protein